MLEVKNLVKKYVSKKGTVVKALDDVSIKFPNTGMVFILGKSGSGKSTLLNVMGGLDTPDSGEIIIKNKSSRNFLQSDFDCYRNTYLGFIFQEYNLLDDFNVEENISLALELQKKELNPFELTNILDKVGLRGLGKRKVSELSGGQKQRVAIARALVKNPDIIFADEPSGALDSNTGKQIFDTLKLLSEEKLVVIISHDRDFAEFYGDRIIELRDGKIYSDVTKTTGRFADKGIIELGNGVIKIAKGRKLSSQDVQRINDIIGRNSEDMYLSYNTIFNQTIGSVIGDDSNAVSFIKTNESLIFSDDSHFEPIKSKLSWKKCIKMSLSIIKHKPIRLIITVLLCFISFTLFALTSIFATYNSTDSMTNTIKTQNNEYIPISKAYNSVQSNKKEFKYSPMLMDEEDVANIKTSLKNVSETKSDPTAISVYSSSANTNSTFISVPVGETEYNSNYYTSGIYGLISETDMPKKNPLISGNSPSVVGEIAVTKNFFDTIKENGKVFFDIKTNNIIKRGIENPSDLLGLPLYYGNYTFFICGVYDTKFDKSQYSDLLNEDEVSKNPSKYNELIERFKYTNQYSLHSIGVVSQETLDALIAAESKKISSGKLDAFCFHTRFVYRGKTVTFETIEPLASAANSTLGIIPNKSARPENVADGVNSYISSFRFLSMLQDGGYVAYPIPRVSLDITDPELLDLLGTSQSEEEEKTLSWTFNFNTILTDIKTFIYQAMSAKYFEGATDNFSFIAPYVSELELGTETRDYTNKPITINNKDYPIRTVHNQARRLYDNILETLLVGSCSEVGFVKRTDNPLLRNEFATLYLRFESTTLDENNILGNTVSANGYNHGRETYLAGIIRKLDENTIYVNPELAEEFYKKTTKKPYKYVLYENKNNDQSVIKSLVNSTYSFVEYRTANYITYNYTFSSFDMVDSFISGLSRIFLIVGGVLGAFAIILFSNFISTSINDKQADIGILRALGSRGRDIFKLFLVESFLIALLCSILSLGTTFLSTFALNITFTNIAAMKLTIFIPGPLHISLIFALSFIVAIVSSFIPVNKIASKKPVDAIRKSI